MSAPTCSAVEATVYRLTRLPDRTDIGGSRAVRLLVSAERTKSGWTKHSVQTLPDMLTWSWSNDIHPAEQRDIEHLLDAAAESAVPL